MNLRKIAKAATGIVLAASLYFGGTKTPEVANPFSEINIKHPRTGDVYRIESVDKIDLLGEVFVEKTSKIYTSVLFMPEYDGMCGSISLTYPHGREISIFPDYQGSPVDRHSLFLRKDGESFQRTLTLAESGEYKLNASVFGNDDGQRSEVRFFLK
ncbi:MAG: hypothetical protein HY831_03025 [Candidatus Aenigmarchaeota archaeon]|nr:hypothetical protein [Candidatus Aenigmarchaeota archaeon]